MIDSKIPVVLIAEGDVVTVDVSVDVLNLFEVLV